MHTSSQSSSIDSSSDSISEERSFVSTTSGRSAQAQTTQSLSVSQVTVLAFWLSFCAATALQPMFNSVAVGDYFSTGVKTEVGKPEIYMVPEGDYPGLNLAFGLFGLIANVVITHVFFPQTLEKMKEIYHEPQSSFIIGVSLFFGCAAAAITFQLSRDSFTLGGNKGNWQILNYALIILAVIPTLCSRFKGSHAMLSTSWRIGPQIKTLGSYVYSTNDSLSWAITIQNDFLRSVYTLPPLALEELTGKMQNGDWEDAINYFYNGAQDREAAAWSGLYVNYARSGLYWSLQAAFATISMGASLVVYNINFHLTAGVGQLFWARALAILLTSPATLYYIYSLSGLPDKIIRTFALACKVNDWRVWLFLTTVYGVALGSCGNLLYSGMVQGLDGDFAWTGLSKEVNTIVAAFLGGAISSLCNLFALLDVFEQDVKRRFNLTQDVKAYEDRINQFMNDFRQEMSVMDSLTQAVRQSRFVNSTGAEIYSPLVTDPESQEDLENSSVEEKNKSILAVSGVAKNFYSHFANTLKETVDTYCLVCNK